jgi:branched-subunit amino acid aminotransferase/4-amino-4-deoxychorismate lyase
MADQQAAGRDLDARALLLDEAGYVNETSTANVVAVFKTNELVTPPADDVLHGISLAEVKELADEMGLSWSARSITMDELAGADELLLTSTPYCLLPCCRLNGQPVGTGAPGAIFAQLLAAWSNKVGVDIAQQAQRGAA